MLEARSDSNSDHKARVAATSVLEHDFPDAPTETRTRTASLSLGQAVSSGGDIAFPRGGMQGPAPGRQRFDDQGDPEFSFPQSLSGLSTNEAVERLIIAVRVLSIPVNTLVDGIGAWFSKKQSRNDVMKAAKRYIALWQVLDDDYLLRSCVAVLLAALTPEAPLQTAALPRPFSTGDAQREDRTRTANEVCAIVISFANACCEAKISLLPDEQGHLPFDNLLRARVAIAKEFDAVAVAVLKATEPVSHFEPYPLFALLNDGEEHQTEVFQQVCRVYPAAASAPDASGKPPVHKAIENANHVALRVLLNVCPAEAISTDASGNLPLQTAIEHGNGEALRVLLDACPDAATRRGKASASGGFGDLPLHLVIKRKWSDEMVRLVLGKHPRVAFERDCRPPGRYAYELALDNGYSADIVRDLLAKAPQEVLIDANAVIREKGSHAALRVLLELYPDAAAIRCKSSGDLLLHSVLKSKAEPSLVRVVLRKHPPAAFETDGAQAGEGAYPYQLALSKGYSADVVRDLLSEAPQGMLFNAIGVLLTSAVCDAHQVRSNLKTLTEAAPSVTARRFTAYTLEERSRSVAYQTSDGRTAHRTESYNVKVDHSVVKHSDFVKASNALNQARSSIVDFKEQVASHCDRLGGNLQTSLDAYQVTAKKDPASLLAHSMHLAMQNATEERMQAATERALAEHGAAAGDIPALLRLAQMLRSQQAAVPARLEAEKAAAADFKRQAIALADAERVVVEQRADQESKELQDLLDAVEAEVVVKQDAQARQAAEEKQREKQRKASEARANAKNELHRQMFAVADKLGSTFSTLREANSEARFECKDLIFGRPEQAALGVEHYMCVDDADLRLKMNEGIAAMRAEVEKNGTDVDKECLKYVLEMEAGSSATAFQSGLKRDCDEQGNVLPERRGKRLTDFVGDSNARTAKLSEAHVAALRYYTTAAFRTINNGLRDQDRYKAERPHPFPVTVAFIKEALGRLRVVAGKSAQSNTMITLCIPIWSSNSGLADTRLTLYPCTHATSMTACRPRDERHAGAGQLPAARQGRHRAGAHVDHLQPRGGDGVLGLRELAAAAPAHQELHGARPRDLLPLGLPSGAGIPLPAAHLPRADRRDPDAARRRRDLHGHRRPAEPVKLGP